jgi:hypothetical protein
MPSYYQPTPESEARYEAINRRRLQWEYIEKMRNLMPSGYLCSIRPVERDEEPDCDKWEVDTHGRDGLVIHPCDHVHDVERTVQAFLFELTPEDEHEALSAILEDPSIIVGRWGKAKA